MKVLVAGDYCPRGRVAELFEESEYDRVLGEVIPYTRQADFSIVNLECPICNGAEKPIRKWGPNLRSSYHGVEALRKAGFHCVTLANNHFLDYGPEGVENTLKLCGDYGIETVGGGRNLSEASAVFYKELGGKILAVINCCEHEFSIATETSAGSNPLNPVRQFYAIQEARKKADVILVIVHGGHEHFHLPSPRMQETYRFFIDAGADAVVSHHQHCFSGYETYKGKPIFYGLGNFCFDSPDVKNTSWNDGFMLQIEFGSKEIRTEIYPYKQCSERPAIEILDHDALDKRLIEINTIIENEELLKQEVRKYYENEKKLMSRLLRYRGILPLLQSRKKVTQIQNYISCEAHREKLEYYFENLYGE